MGRRARQGVEARQFDAEHLLVEKQQGEKRLVLRAGGDVLVDGQIGEEQLDFRSAQRAGVAHSVKADEAFDPIGIAVLGTGRVMAETAGAAEAVEEARRLGDGPASDVEGEDVLVKEGEGGVGLVEAGQRVFFRLGDVLEEPADVGSREVAGMAFVVKEDQTAGPVGEALAGAVLAEAELGGAADEVEKARRGARESATDGGDMAGLHREMDVD